MEKYKNLNEKEKRLHKEALQRYQEDHMDKMEIINLHKRCNKKVPQPKKVLKSFKSDKPKKAPSSSGLIDDPSKEEQKPKKASGPSDGKKTATKADKKVKKTSQPKKAPKSPEFIDSSEEEEEEPPLLRVKEEVQIVFDLQKERKNLTFKKKVEKVVFIGGPMKAMNYHMLHYVILNTSWGC